MKKIYLLVTFIALVITGCQKPVGGESTPAPNPPSNLSITYDPIDYVIAGACSKEHRVSAVDINGKLSNVSVDQIVRLTSPSVNVTFYSDSECLKSVSSVKIKSGTSSISFFIKTSAPEYFSFTAATPNIRSDTQSHTAISANASRISFIGPNTVSAGECSSPFTIKTRNISGQETEVTNDTTVNMSGMGLGRFYLNSNCEGTALTSVVVPAGKSNTQFYFKSTKTGAYNMSASAPGPVTDNLFISVKAGSPTQIVFLTAPQAISAGTCSSGITIQHQDSYGNPSSLPTSSDVILSGENVSFYLNNNCLGSGVGKVSVDANSSTGTFYLSSTNVESNSISVSGIATQTQTLTVTPGRAVKLFLPALANTVTAGAVFNKINVTVKDQFDNTISGVNRQYNISSFSDNSCNIPSSVPLGGLTQITTPGTAAFSTLNYSKAEQIYLGVRSSGLVSVCSSVINVNPDYPSKTSISGQATVKAGSCSSSFIISATDSYNNPSNVLMETNINLAGNGSGYFYGFPDCSGNPITTVKILAGSNNAKVYFKSSTIESVIFSSSGLGAGSSTLPVNIIAGDPTKIEITTPVSITAGQCASGFSLKTQDQFGNNAPVSADTRIDLTQSGSALFFTDASCVNQVSFVFINKDTFSRQIYVKDTKAENLTITASGLGSTSKATTVTPAIATKLKISAPQIAIAGKNIDSLFVEIQDQHGNRQTNSINSIGLTSYKDRDCSIETSSQITGNRTVAAAAGISSFDDIKYNLVEKIYLKATSGSLTSSCSQEINVYPATASKVEISILDSPIVAGTCSRAMIKTKDAAGNESAVEGSKTVNLASDYGGKFYLNSGCSSSVTSFTIQDNTSELAVFYKATVAAETKIYASSPELNGSNITVSIQPGDAAGLKLTGPSEFVVNKCSPAYSILVLDQFNNQTKVNNNVTINLSTESLGSFYSDDECSYSISSFVLERGSGKSTIYFKSNKAETVSFSAAGSTLNSDTLSGINIKADIPRKINVDGLSSFIAGTCSSPQRIQLKDQFDNLTSSESPVLINIETESSAFVYLDSACTGIPVSNVSIPIGVSEVSIFLKGYNAESAQFKFTSTNLQYFNKNITIAPGFAHKLKFKTNKKQLIAGVCSSAVEIVAVDSFENETSVLPSEKITFGNSTVKFYSQNGCENEVGFLNIQENTSGVSFYIKSERTSPTTIEVTGERLGLERQDVEIQANEPKKLLFSKIPTSGYPGTPAFSSPIEILVSDIYGNKVSAAQNSIIIESYSNQGCSIPTSQPIIGETQKLAVDGVGTYSDLTYNSSETIYIKALSPGLDVVCSNSIQIDSAAPYKTILVGPSSGLANQCSGPFDLVIKDYFGNETVTNSNINANINGKGNLSIYYSSDCSGQKTDTVTVLSGESRRLFYLKGTVAQNLILEAESPLGSATLPYSVSSLSPIEILVTGPEEIKARVCSGPYSVNSLDEFGNKSQVSTNESISLENNGSVKMFNDSLCNVEASVIEIKSGDSETLFYTKGTAVESLSISFITQSLGSKVFNLNIKSPPPSIVQVVEGSNSLIAGECGGPFHVELKDEDGNLVVSDSPIKVDPKGGTSGVFFSDSSCLNQITFFSIPTGANSKSVWFKSTKAESTFLEFTSDSLENGSIFPVTINAAGLSSIAFISQPPNVVISSEVFSSSVDVAYSDEYGNIIFGKDDPISISLETDVGQPRTGLSGDLTLTPDISSGVVKFTNLTARDVGSYKLNAAGSGFSRTSSTFTVKAGSPSKISITSGNNQSIARGKKTKPLIVKIEDNQGNSAKGFVDFKIVTGSGSIIQNGQQEIQVSSNESTGEAEIEYNAGTLVENSTIKATNVENGAFVEFTISTVDYSPIVVTISEDSPLDYVINGSPLSIGSNGNGLTYENNIFPVSYNLSLTSSGSGLSPVEFLATVKSKLSPLVDLGNPLEEVSLRIEAEYPEGTSGGNCNFLASSLESIHSNTCELTGVSTKIKRQYFNGDYIQSQVFSNGENVGDFDYTESNILTTNLIKIKRFSNISSSNDENPKDLVVFGSDLYFTAKDDDGNRKIYKTNGESITKISNIRNGSDDNPSNLVSVSDKFLYFSGFNSNGVVKLFRYDGEKIEKVLDSENNSTVDDVYLKMTPSEDKLFVVASTGSQQNEAITKIHEIGDNSASIVVDLYGPSSPDYIEEMQWSNGALYFSNRSQSGSKLYKKTNSEVEVISNTSGSADDDVAQIMSDESSLFVLANNSLGNRKLFMLDEASQSLVQLSNLAGGGSSDEIKLLGSCSGGLFFAAEKITGSRKFKLFVFNKISGEINQVSDNVDSGTDFSSFERGICYNGDFFVSLINKDGNEKLFKHDGVNLMQVSNIVEGSSDEVRSITLFNNAIYFTAKSTANPGTRVYRMCNPKAGCSE